MVKVNVRGIIGACIPAVSIIIIFITMFSNGWYTYDEEGREYNIGLTEMESSYGGHSESDDLDSDTEDVGSLTQVFLIIGLILIFGFVSVGIVAALRLIPSWIPMIVGFVAAACLIFVIIYYPAAIPGALEDDGCPDEVLNDFSPGWSYYLTIGALVALLPGPFMFIGIKRVKRHPSRDDRPPAMGHPSDPYGPPPRRDDYYEDRRRDDYYDDRDRRDHPPPRRDDYYHDRR